jgi:hypothetical protein
MMKRASLVLAVLALLGDGGRARAGFITVDPDSVANGASLTNAFAGVTIRQGNGGTGITAAVGITGTRQFSINGITENFVYLPAPPPPTLAAALSASLNPGTILRFDFATATDSVSLDLIANDSGDPGSIAAYDAAGNLLGYASFSGINQTGVRNTLTINAAGIRTLLAGGDNIGNNLDIDTLVYSDSATAVPAPAGLVLVASAVPGLLGVRLWRRRKAA